MCGIAGFVNFDSAPQKRVLISQLEQIVHRGPDARGVYLNKHVALGIQRLSIIDLKTGDQPISNESGTVVVVFNGEIYNYQELRKNLLHQGHKFKTKSDTEVLVHLYEELGDDMPKFLNGMFAFAIWDTQKEELFIARDQVGIKPLFYFHSGPLLVFGSEVKAILVHPKVKKEINSFAVAAYATFGYIGGSDSIFKHIFKLLPGMCLRFSKGKITIRRYWSLGTSRFNSLGSLEVLLRKAARLQSIADVQVGVFLSGGLDSSLLLYYLSQIQKKKVHTFSVGFDEKTFDESRLAQNTAKEFGSNHHVTNLSSGNLIDLFPEVLQKLDEPLADPSLFPTYKVSKLAKEYVKVVLSGDGGDELFAGYPTYQGHLLAEKLRVLPPQFFSLLKHIISFMPVRSTNFPVQEVVQVFLENTTDPFLFRHLAWMSHLFANTHSLLRSEFKRTFEPAGLNEILQLPIDTLGKIQALDFNTYLRDDLLVKADRASMYNSLELRVPYLDTDLIKYAFSLTQREKVDLFETKKPLRWLAKKLLPVSIWSKRKKGFGIPLSQWLHTDLIEMVNRALQREELYEYFDRKKVNEILLTHRKRGLYNRQIWQLMLFSEWLVKWGNT